MLRKAKNYSAMLKWWLIFCFVIFSTIYAQISINLFATLNEADVTKISFLVIIIFYSYFIALGARLTKFSKNIQDTQCQKSVIKIQKHGWFLSDIFMALGFLGTLVGFIYMLDLTALSSDNMSKEVLVTLTTGMRTALYTTVMALIASIIIKATLYIVGNDLEETNSCYIDN